MALMQAHGSIGGREDEARRMNIFDLVIFGGMGDLSRRKLLPALYNGLAAGLVDDTARIFLTTRSEVSEGPASWLKGVLEAYTPSCGLDAAVFERFVSMVHFVQLDLTSADAGTSAHANWQAFAQSIEDGAVLASGAARPVVHFLAIPPGLFASSCSLLGQFGLNGERTRVVIEKPLGHDQASANTINAQVAEHFGEAQTFRIDHYLGKEAVQNLLALRFSNVLFEELWSSKTIDHIQITLAEDLGVEGRSAFYEGTGAMRDMVQNHMLQLLCLVAMEPPARMDAASIREEKLKVLRALEPIGADEIDERVVRAQYVSGAVGGKAVGDYQTDLGLDAPSQTETFVAIKAHIENWRWAGVPFYLRTGKRLPERFAEIVIQFKNVPHAPHKGWAGQVQPNRFIIRMQPEDHLALRMMVKDHTMGEDALKEVELNLDMGHGEHAPRLGPYLRLVLDAAMGDQRLFVHRKEVDLAWAWVDKIIAHWQGKPKSLKSYTSGTWGPYEAHDLITQDGRQWFHEVRSKAGKL